MLELLRRNQAQAEAIVGTDDADFHRRWKLEGRSKVSFKSVPQSGALCPPPTRVHDKGLS
jgi:hypothetical protein